MAMSQNPGTQMVPSNSWFMDSYIPPKNILIGFDTSPYISICTDLPSGKHTKKLWKITMFNG